MRVAAFTKYGRLAASTRQRILQYVPHLEAAAIRVDYHPLLGHDYVASLATGTPVAKTVVARSYAARMKLLLALDCDLIWVYAELFPYLPAPFEKLAFRTGKPVVYDFDDAFFHQYDDSPRRVVRATLAGKLESLLAGATACCCGNAYLQDYALRFCENSIVLPTVVDTAVYGPLAKKRDADDRIVIGWIGSPSTWKFLMPLLPLLKELAAGRRVSVRIIGGGAKAKLEGPSEFEFVEWCEDAEVSEVQSMDIGIMPLPDELWARGKSGYKLIQYMACGLPVVASPVGVNCEIVQESVTGFLASGPEEWRQALVRLIGDAPLRRRMGAAGRLRVEKYYSLKVHAPRLVELLRTANATGAVE